MKRVLLFLLIVGPTAFSMEKSDNESDEASVDGSAYEAIDEIASTPPRTLPNFETYLFIDSLKPGEVLLSETTEACLNASNLFKNFLVVCYQSARYQDAFYFVPEKMANDAEKALSLYSETNPGFYAHLITIKEEGKFWELASKTSLGCANKDGSWTSDVRWVGLDGAFSEGHAMLDKGKIEYAMAAPSQGSDQKNGNWSCGPNSGFRALRLLSESSYNYDSFVECCPQRISKSATIENGGTTAGVGVGLTFAGMIFAPFTAGLSLIPGVVTYAVGVGTTVTGASISSNVGPSPEMLANYLTRTMNTYRAGFSGYSSQTDYEKSIAADIRRGYPRIVLIVSGTTSMHYVTIVGVNPSGDYFREAVILDTDGTIGIMSDSKLRDWLDCYGYAGWLLDARYNTVEFFKK